MDLDNGQNEEQLNAEDFDHYAIYERYEMDQNNSPKKVRQTYRLFVEMEIRKLDASFNKIRFLRFLLAKLTRARYIELCVQDNLNGLIHYVGKYFVEQLSPYEVWTKLRFSLDGIHYKTISLEKMEDLDLTSETLREYEIPLPSTDPANKVTNAGSRFRLVIHVNRYKYILFNLTIKRYLDYLCSDQFMFNFCRELLVPNEELIYQLYYSPDEMHYELSKHFEKVMTEGEEYAIMPEEWDEVYDEPYTDDDYVKGYWGFSKAQLDWEKMEAWNARWNGKMSSQEAPLSNEEKCSALREKSELDGLDLTELLGGTQTNNLEVGGIKCYCGELAKEMTSSRSGFEGRKYYKCPKLVSAGDCNFFLWADAGSSSRTLSPVELGEAAEELEAFEETLTKAKAIIDEEMGSDSEDMSSCLVVNQLIASLSHECDELMDILTNQF